MAQDSFDLDIPQPPPSGMQPFPETLPPPPAPPRDPHRHVLLAGVAGACVLGAGLGLWARPAESERRASLQPVATAQPAARLSRQIQIVVDDTPAPLGPPMEVMRALESDTITPEPPQPQPELEPEPAAPIRPPAGLVRVLATPLPPATAELPPPRVARKPTPQVQAMVEVEKRPEKARKVETVTAQVKKTAPKAKAEQTERRLAKAKAEKPDAKLAKAKPDRKASKAQLAAQDAKAPDGKSKGVKSKLAKAEKPRKEADKAKLAKAERTKAAETAARKSEAKKSTRLASAVKKVIRKSPADKSKAEVAEKAGKLKLATAKPKPKAEAAPVRKSVQPVPGGGPLRMVSNRCASTDPAAALVCADPSLGAADRRLHRAYRQAEAAGVSAGELRRQQERWLAARAAAAREAPWAVQDVYQARIAELEGMTRGADGGY